MHTINDSMLALILRFVGGYQETAFCNQEFMQKQVTAIRKHVDKFPSNEKEFRAIEWIEKNARQYRRLWQKEVIKKELSEQRCPDCPLAKRNILKPCQIHSRWLELLQQYVNDEINSKEYVERALKLLNQHKENLKVKLSVLDNVG
jgi:hypothetical protein